MSIRPPSAAERTSYVLQAAAFYFFVGVSRMVGLGASSCIMGRLSRFLGPKLKLSARAHDNLKLALPELGAAQRNRIVADMWENFGRTIGEYPHLKTLAKHRDRYVETVGFDIAYDVIKRYGRGIYVSGHFANWEVLLLIPASEHKGALVYRAPNNPFIAKWINRQRAYLRPILQVSKSVHGGREMHNILKDGGYLCALVDQKLSGGIAVPFFGYPAPTSPTMARLALRHNCPVVPVGLERRDGTHFVLTVHPPLLAKEGLSDTDKIFELTERINLFLENEIRAHPAQWLWLHRRWGKHLI